MRYLIPLIWILLLACHNSGSIKIPYDNNGLPLPNQLTELFKNGKHSATLITNKELIPAQKKIFKKFLHIVSTNEELQKEVDNFLEHPELVEHTPNFGLTKKELRILSSIFTKKETSTEKGAVAVSTDGNYITLKGSGRLSILDSLTIILKDTSAIFRETKLEYYSPDSSYISNEFIPSDEHLEYIFPFDEASNGLLELLPIGNRYRLFVGRLSKSGKTYLYLEVKELDINKPFNPFYSIILD
jgi:hypothetical protein